MRTPVTNCEVVQDTVTERSPEEPHDWTRRVWSVVADTAEAVHLHNRFFSTEAAAQKLADSVKACGTIDLDHWHTQHHEDLPDYVLDPHRQEFN